MYRERDIFLSFEILSSYSSVHFGIITSRGRWPVKQASWESPSFHCTSQPVPFPMWSPRGPALSEMGCEAVPRPLPQESPETTSSNCMGDVLLLDVASMSGFNTTPGSQEVSILLPPCSSYDCCRLREKASLLCCCSEYLLNYKGCYNM